MRIPFASLALAALVACGADSLAAEVRIKETDATATHPNMYLNATEIAQIKSRVEAGARPWKRAYDQLMTDAAAALEQVPLSVTHQGDRGHAYHTEGPYCGWSLWKSPCGRSCCDGRINPAADRGDFKAATRLGRAMPNLGLAYAFTGEARYAAKAVELIRAWCLDATTYMEPVYTNGQSTIELSITLPGLLYGADLIWDYPGFTAGDKAAFQAWTRAIAASLKERRTETDTNNYGDWRLVMLAASAVITDDAALMRYVVGHYQALVPHQIDAAGKTVKELDRTKALDYASFAINAISQVCEIARHSGADLYNFRTPDGRGSIERAFTWLAPYAMNPSTWPYRQIAPYKGANVAVFEFAYLTWDNSVYLNTIERWKRPTAETRTAGPLTLTHARGAYTWKVWPRTAGHR
jgi:Alginate lyase